MKTSAGVERWRHRIDDGRGHELTYDFRPALDPARAPLLVVFHDQAAHHRSGDGRDSGYDIDPAWNVLLPHDQFGLDQRGSWWLGEHGDFFMVDLVGRMLAETWQRYGIDLKALYAWGEGMVGFGALLHGFLAGARAICVSSPQVCLLGTEWSASTLPQMEVVFGRDIARRTVGAGPDLGAQAADLPSDVRLFHDATNFINYEDAAANPFVLVGRHQPTGGANHADEQTGYLTQKLLRAGASFRLDVTREVTQTGPWRAQRAVDLFSEHLNATAVPSPHAPSHVEASLHA